MFGVIIICLKENNFLVVKFLNEILWCSYEIDIKWYKDDIMGIEYDVLNRLVIFFEYKSGYFLINGEIVIKNKGL